MMTSVTCTAALEQELAEGEVEIRFRADGAASTVDFDADVDDRDGFSVPVIVLTAKDAVLDRVDNLNAGADDYGPLRWTCPSAGSGATSTRWR